MKPSKNQLAAAVVLESLEGRTLLSSTVEIPADSQRFECISDNPLSLAPCWLVGPTGTISGRVYEDKNDNGVMDEGENPVGFVAVTLRGDNFEKEFSHSFHKSDPETGLVISSMVARGTAGDGLYNFSYVAQGEMTLTAESTDRTFIETRVITLNVTDFENHTIDIGVKVLPAPPVVVPVAPTVVPTLHKVRSTAFIDSNRNAIFDRGEPVLRRAGVFIDKNRNGKRDRNERLHRTNAAGRFSLTTSARQFQIKFLVPQRYAHQGIFNSAQQIDASATTGPIQLLIGLKPRG
jgi:hypothetical protein